MAQKTTQKQNVNQILDKITQSIKKTIARQAIDERQEIDLEERKMMAKIEGKKFAQSQLHKNNYAIALLSRRIL